jgi:Xaa-Pro aminopeptidase
VHSFRICGDNARRRKLPFLAAAHHSNWEERTLPDKQRMAWIEAALNGENLDAVICALPPFVLLLSGYCPVSGASLAIATRDGWRALLVPEDEEQLAKNGEADEIRTYNPGSLEKLQSVIEAAAEPLRQLLKRLGLTCARVGYEFGPATAPASYPAMHVFGGSIVNLLRAAAPADALAPADEMLAQLAAIKTSSEVERIRTACEIAGQAFEQGRAGLRPGLQETAAAELFHASLTVIGAARKGVQRAEGFAWCMSGRNSAHASAAYSQSRADQVGAHEFVLVHCTSCADGYWTDVTRTYVLGAPEQRQLRLYEAVFSARAAALAAIRPGARASEVDRAAREVLKSRGVAEAFRHSTGHGVGFAAAPRARPQIHPRSEEILETGMVFVINPAVYVEGYGGLRHGDVVTVTASGVEVLTPFQAGTTSLLLEKIPVAA